MRRVFAITGLLALCAFGARAADLRVIDGDTFAIGPEVYRLLDIDAPETAQSCIRRDGTSWACGDSAAKALGDLLSAGTPQCQVTDQDRYGRHLTRCFVGGQDIGARMVHQGHALAFVRYGTRYVPQENAARQAGRGIWSGNFQKPWEFRDTKWTARVDQSSPTNCPIKGNISASGERIYHTPYSRHYQKTRINLSRGERWFCDEGQARAAGWRAPYS